jgi:Tol biopolymer transport system component
MIVNIRARQYARLCLTDNTAGHPQWTHAHPAFSPDGRRAVYTSDRTGMCQVYVADVPEEFKAWVATPNPDAAPGGRLPEWRPE